MCAHASESWGMAASCFLEIITAFRSLFCRLFFIYLGVWRKRSWELGCCLRHRQIPPLPRDGFFCVTFVVRLVEKFS